MRYMCCYCYIEVSMSKFQRLSGFCTVIVLPPCDIRSADNTMRLWQIMVIFQCILKERSIRNFIVPWHLAVTTRKSRTPESRTPVIQLIGAMTPSQWVTSDSWTCFPSKLNTCTGAWVAPLVGSSINIFFDLCRPQIGSYKYIKDVQIQDK